MPVLIFSFGGTIHALGAHSQEYLLAIRQVEPFAFRYEVVCDGATYSSDVKFVAGYTCDTLTSFFLIGIT